MLGSAATSSEECPLPPPVGRFLPPLYLTMPCTHSPKAHSQPSRASAKGVSSSLCSKYFPPAVCTCHSLSSCRSLLKHHPLYEAISEYPLQGATHTHAPLTLILFPHSIYTCVSVRCRSPSLACGFCESWDLALWTGCIPSTWSVWHMVETQ